jgi:MFS family permease
MLTLAANIDKKGRWAAAAGGAFIISTAFGPIVGAALIETKGYASIAWLQVLGTLPAIYIFVRVNKNSCTTD